MSGIPATQPPAGTRIETDSLGEVAVPADHLWGAQTQRSIENFPIGVGRFAWTPPVIRAFGILKKCAALANGELGELPAEKVELIVRAAQEVIDGRWNGEFPLVVFQTGSGTQSNMNANEVIANRAIQMRRRHGRLEEADPSERRRQSRPVVERHVPDRHAYRGRARRSPSSCFPRSRQLRDTLDAKARSVRRCRHDRPHASAGCDADHARPGDFGLGRAARRSARRRSRRRLPRPAASWRSAARRSAPASTRIRASARSRRARSPTRPGMPFVSAPNKFAALSAHDAHGASSSGALRTLAGALMKIANDVRWLRLRARAPASARSRFRRTSPAPRSCRARSTRPSARR